MKLRTVLTSALFAAGVAAANAAPVGYDGAVFDFSITPVSGSTYSLTYTADFSSFANSAGSQHYVAAINWQISGAGLESVSLVDSNALGGWLAPMLNADTSANGCKSNGNGTRGFVCLEATNWLAQATEGSVYWTFNATFDSPLTAAQFENEGNPILARFAEADKKGRAQNSGLMSCLTGNTNGACGDVYVQAPPPVDPVATVPEPGVAGLLGLGALGLMVSRRRRQGE